MRVSPRARSRFLGGLVAATLVVGLLAPIDVPIVGGVERAAAAAATSMERISVTAAGGQASGTSGAISGDGTTAVFVSGSSALGVSSGVAQVFLKDLASGVTTRISSAPGGGQGNAGSSQPSISEDGSVVAFVSSASNLVAGDTNGAPDAFVWHESTGTIERVSVSSSGAEANGATTQLDLADGGGSVAFRSSASNLVATDLNGTRTDVFFRDLAAGTTTLVSTDCCTHNTAVGCAGCAPQPSGVQLSAQSISADGRYVTWTSHSFIGALQSSCPTGGPYRYGAWVTDTTTGAVTQLGAYNQLGCRDNGPVSPTISPDGSTIAYLDRVGPGAGGNIALWSPNGSSQGSVDLPDLGSKLGDPWLSGDGSLAAVWTVGTVFGPNLLVNQLYLVSASSGQIEIASTTPSGQPGNGSSGSGSLSHDGSEMVFTSSATDLVSGDTNGTADVFRADVALPSQAILGLSEVFGANRALKWQCPCTGEFADPVNTRTGNLHMPLPGMQIPGRGPGLGFSLAYNSLGAQQDGPLGYGWSHSYGMSLQDDTAGTMTVTQEGGATVPFTATGGGWEAPPRATATLVENLDGTYTFTRRQLQEFDFDAEGLLIAMRDHNGYETTLAYDTSDQLETVTDHGGRTLSFTWSSGRIGSISDSRPSGEGGPRSVAFTYSGGDLVGYTDVGGGEWVMTYDGSHRMLTLKKPRQSGGQVVENHYDAQGRVDWQEDELDRRSYLYYDDPVPGATRLVEPDGDQRVDWYDESGLRTKITRGYGTAEASDTEFTYDPATLAPLTKVDGNSETWLYEYDAAGNRTKATDPLGRDSTATYNALDLPLLVTDGEGVQTEYVYDTVGNLENLTVAKGTAVQAVTDLVYGDIAHPGDVTSVIDARGKTWTSTYDPDTGYATSSTDPLGNETTWTFDTVGFMTAHTAAKGNAAGATAEHYRGHFTYNDYGDPLTVTNPADELTTWTYDANRNVATVTDNDGETVTHSYDAADQLIATEQPDTTTVAYAWGSDGLLQSWTSAGGGVWSSTYDSLGRLQTETDPNNQVTGYLWDGNSNLIMQEQPGGDCLAGTKVGCVTYSYDLANQLTSIDYSDPETPDVTDLSYDDNGRRVAATQATTPPVTQTWDWDERGRLTAHNDTLGKTTNYGWDPAGNLATITYPGETTPVTYGYDDAGRATTVTDWLGNVTTLGLDEHGNHETITFPTATGNVDEFTYDHADRMLTATWNKNGNPLGSVSYDPRDPEGLLSVADTTGLPGPDETYGYDDRDQLISVNSDTATYDDAGNLTRRFDGATQAFDPAQQLCWSSPSGGSGSCGAAPGDAITHTYDTRGNRTVSIGAAGTVAYTYDQANRLTATGASTYGYDADGLRIAKTTVDSTVTVVAQDRFERTVVDGWGAADVGGAWSLPGGAAQYSVTGGTGRQRMHAPGVQRENSLASVSATDVLATVDVSFDADPTGGGQYVSLVVRQDGTDDYRVRVRAMVASTTLTLFKTVGGTSTALGSVSVPGLVYENGDVLRIRFEVTGSGTTALAAKVWKVGDNEPVGWQVTDTDSTAALQGPGGIGLVSYLSGATGTVGPVVAHYDNLLVSDTNSTPYTATSEPVAGTVGQTDVTYSWTQHGGLPLLLSQTVDDVETQLIYDPRGMPLAEITNTDIVWYHHDQLGSTRLLTNHVGDAVGTYTFSAYGTLADSTGTHDPILDFAGQYTDPDTGLQYLRARHYDPTTGQFLTRDPLVSVSQDPFGYASNNPISGSDPSGLIACGRDPGHYIDREFDYNFDSMSCDELEEFLRGAISEQRKRGADLFFNPLKLRPGSRSLTNHFQTYDHNRGLIDEAAEALERKIASGECDDPGDWAWDILNGMQSRDPEDIAAAGGLFQRRSWWSRNAGTIGTVVVVVVASAMETARGNVNA